MTRPDAAAQLIVFVGDAARTSSTLARSLERLGYATMHARTVDEIEGARPPVAVIAPAPPGADPFRTVRKIRARARFAHTVVIACTPDGFAPPIGLAIAAGADDLLSTETPLDESVDRVAGRLARSRMLSERATFDCITQIRGRRYVDEWLSSEIALVVAEQARATLGVFVVGGFRGLRAKNGLLAAEREIETAAFALASALRPCDVACRVADETFLVLLPGVAGSAGVDLLREAHKHMATKAPAVGDVSIVFAVAPTEGIAWEDLFACAERRLESASLGYEGAHIARPNAANVAT